MTSVAGRRDGGRFLPAVTLRFLATLLVLLPALAAAQFKDIGKVPAPPPPRPANEAPRPATTPRTNADPLLQQALAALTPQRPGHRDLFVLAIAGDGSEDVFRNEVLHLRNLAAQRLDAAGHVLVLANHPPSRAAAALPEASPAQIRAALAGIGARMDVEEDILLLYITTHGTPDHELYLNRPGRFEDFYKPRPLRAALDASRIRHRVIVLSACFAGGFADQLADDDTLLLMAARRDRPSFGCGNDSAATYFGRAWLVDALNTTVDFAAAFEQARTAIRARERADDLDYSYPQIATGRRIGAVLQQWRAGFVPGPALPFPYADAQEPPRRHGHDRDDDSDYDDTGDAGSGPIKEISGKPRRGGS